jgi:ankyrin repeat protein
MSTDIISSRFSRSPIPHCAAVVLLALALISGVSSCARKDLGSGDIFDAAKRGDVEKVKALVEDNPHLVSSKDNYGMTPLHLAANKNVAEVLLANKAVVDARDDHGRTPLNWAIQSGRYDVVELLLAKGAEVNAKDDTGRTSLHLAAVNSGHKGRKEVVELLLAKGADVNAKDDHGLTPLFWAAACGDQVVVELLLAKGADINAKNNNGVTPLHMAISNRRRPDFVEFLRQHGGQDSASTNTPPKGIHSAVLTGNLEMVQTLLQASPNFAVEKDDKGRTPLHYAAMVGRLDIAELLVANKADVNARDNHGVTPLHLASDKAMAELLLANKADVHARNEEGRTPLHMAASRGQAGMKDVAESLLAHGADVNAKANNGWTPLRSRKERR